MNAYALGQMDAVRSFLKESDYADWIAEKVTPQQKVDPMKVMRSVTTGGAIGGALGEVAGNVHATSKVRSKLEELIRSGKYPTRDIAGAMNHPKFDELLEATQARGGSRGQGIGSVAGASLGGLGHLGVNKVHNYLRRRHVAKNIRNVAPKAGLALGATAAAAALANHFLSKTEE